MGLVLALQKKEKCIFRLKKECMDNSIGSSQPGQDPEPGNVELGLGFLNKLNGLLINNSKILVSINMSPSL